MMDDANVFSAGDAFGGAYLTFTGIDGEPDSIYMDKQDAEHIAACLDACRWRPINDESDYTGDVLLTNGVCFEVVFSKDGEFTFSLPATTHWRPIGPLPEVNP